MESAHDRADRPVAVDAQRLLDRVDDPRVGAAGQHNEPLAGDVDDQALLVPHLVEPEGSLSVDLVQARAAQCRRLARALQRHLPRDPPGGGHAPAQVDRLPAAG